MTRLKLRNSFSMTLLFALVVPVLAACGGGTGSTTSATTAPAAATTGTVAEATTAPVAEATTSPGVEATAAPEATASTDATAATTTGGSGGNILRMAESTYPDSLDPQDSSFSNEIAVEILNYEGLTRFDKDLKTVPGAAEKWDINADATEFTFHLRDGLKYSDGSPLTANDFVQALRRSLDPRGTVGDYQGTFFMIKGAQEIIDTQVPTDEGKVDGLMEKLGVSAPDDKTVKFELTQPTPYLPTIAGIWVAYPAKDALVKAGGETWWQDPKNQIGNGPFQISKIDESTKVIEFTANPNYWGGKPKVDGVQYKYIDDLAVALQAYKSGEVDVMTPDPNDVAAINADATLSKEFTDYAGAGTITVEFNLTKAPFDDKSFREAMAYAYDRESVIRDALKDTEIKTLTWIPPGYPGYDKSETRYDFDLAKAKEALAKSKYAGNVPEIKFSYNSNNAANQARVEYVVQMYQKNLGITITPDPVEGKTLTALRKDVATHPQMNGGGWFADYPDQQDWLSIYWHSRTNFAKDVGYKNAEADKLMDAADVEVDPTKRADMYDQAQKMIIGDMPAIIRSNSKNQYLIKPNVKGLDFTPQDSDLPGLITGLLNVTVQ